MPRSLIAATVERVNSLADQLNALSEDERAFFFDLIDPLPEKPEAPVKKTRKKRLKPITMTVPAKKRGLPQDSNATAPANEDLDSPETCIRCPNPIDHNIHHKATYEGYHEFKNAA